MMTPIKKPFGTWPSPLSAALLGYKKRLDDVQFSPDGKTLVWSEGQSGQTLLLARRGADAARTLFTDLSLRPGVGYGGGGFAVHNDFVLFAANGRLYRQSLTSGRPYPITPAFGGLAAPAISPDGRWAAFVHTYEGRDVLAVVPADGSAWPVIAARGADFYMQPVWHPDSAQLAWVEWDFPNMPWDGTRLMLSRWHDGRLSPPQRLDGNDEMPIFQPAFSPDGQHLSYLAQDGEWDSFYLYHLEAKKKERIQSGRVWMSPAWVQGLRTYAWQDARHLVCIENKNGFARLQSIALDGHITQLDSAPYTWLTQPHSAPDGSLALIASASSIPERVVTRKADGQWQIQARAASESIPAEVLPAVQAIQWPAEDGSAIHGLYYAPTSARFYDEGLPPAIVSIHGGPTSQRVANYNPYAAYFASRGYAWLEVNYRGSTGYGRSYMKALYGRWGEIDTRDAVGAARALAGQNLADPQRIAIMGGSAGGYTVLNALIQYPDVFKAGVDMYGVSNLFSLNLDTHKFEQHYNDKLVGILPAAADKFRAWSPVFHADKIRNAIAVFQGAQDKVVVPEQSESIVAALRANHVPHLYHVYENEGHGWRHSETIMDFYPRVERFLLENMLFA